MAPSPCCRILQSSASRTSKSARSRTPNSMSPFCYLAVDQRIIKLYMTRRALQFSACLETCFWTQQIVGCMRQWQWSNQDFPVWQWCKCKTCTSAHMCSASSLWSYYTAYAVSYYTAYVFSKYSIIWGVSNMATPVLGSCIIMPARLLTAQTWPHWRCGFCSWDMHNSGLCNLQLPQKSCSSWNKPTCHKQLVHMSKTACDQIHIDRQ